MRSLSMVGVLGVELVCATLLWRPGNVEASTTMCGASLRDSDCRRLGAPVPANSPVLFSLNCIGGGSGVPDAGAVYAALVIDVTKLAAKAGDANLQGNFENLERTCTDPPQLYPQGGALFRYTGQLKPGIRNEIHYPMNYSAGTPVLSFDVLPAEEGNENNNAGCQFAGKRRNSLGSWLGLPLLFFLWSFGSRLRRCDRTPALQKKSR